MYFDHLQTMRLSFEEMCQGERIWTALGNFLNDWYAYHPERRADLVADPLPLPETYPADMHNWAAFCAASVEYLCERYQIPCPSWVHKPVYCLPKPWFPSPKADSPHVRERLIQKTPEPFTRRNIYCGDRAFQNKWEITEQHRLRMQHSA